MSTSAVYAHISRKRLLGTEDLRDRIVDYVRTLIQESTQRVYPTGATHAAQIDIAAGGTDRITVGTGTQYAGDGLGHILALASSSYLTAYFENAAAIDYHVLLHYADVPDEVQINPRSGQPEYIGTREEIGFSAVPTGVGLVGGGTQIEFTVDVVTEAGVSNAGRTVAVWKVNPGPNATTEAVAVQYLTVTWDGSNNKVTSADLMGQTTASTTAADYRVCLLGPTIKRNGTWDQDTADYCFIGEVTGVGAGGAPTAFDMSGQRVAVTGLDDLEDITARNATTDRLKVDVKAYTGDASDPQIAVRNTSGTLVFTVDGDGNMYVAGTQDIYDTVTVYSSQTITDNLEAGDATSDAHTIKGTWRHTDPTETANYFRVDGTTGHVGINSLPDGSAWLKVAGDVITRHITPETTLNYDLGSASLQWRALYVQTFNLMDTPLTGAPLAKKFNVQWDAALLDGSYNHAASVFADLQSLDAAASMSGLSVRAWNRETVGTFTQPWLGGLWSEAGIDDTGNVTTMDAYSGACYVTHANGDVTGKACVFHAYDGTGTGDIAEAYGLYVAEQTIGTANYGIYVGGGSTRAIKVASGSTELLGDVGIGVAPLSLNRLQVYRTHDDGPGQYSTLLAIATASNTSTGIGYAVRGECDSFLSTGETKGIFGNFFGEFTTSGGPGTVSNCYGFHSKINMGTGGILTNAAQFYAECTSSGAGAQITNRYGMLVGNATTVTVANQYGIKISNLTKGSTNNYGIYLDGASTASIYVAGGDTVLGPGLLTYRDPGSFSNWENDQGWKSISQNAHAATAHSYNWLFESLLTSANAGNNWGGLIVPHVMTHTANALNWVPGVWCEVFYDAASAGGSIDDTECFGCGVYNGGAGTIANGAGLRVYNGTNAGGGTFTNQYGVRVENLTAATNNYGVWIGGGSTRALHVNAGTSYFGGLVTFNLTDDVTIEDADDTGGTVNGYIELTVGAATRYIRLYTTA